MKDRKIFSLTLLTFILLISSCKGIEDIQFTGVNNFVLIEMQDNSVIFSADIGISNPSTLGFRVSEINLRTIIEGQYLGTLINNDVIRIPSRSDSVYNMVFSLRLVNLFTSMSMAYSLMQRDQVNVEMNGYVKSRSGLVTKKVDILEKQLIDVPRFN